MKALIIVDLQNDFITGSLAVKGGSELVNKINLIMDNYSIVVATKDSHPAGHYSFASTHNKKVGESIDKQLLWTDHCVKGTIGEEIHKDLNEKLIIVKKGENIDVDSYSGFFDNNGEKTKLDALLKSKGVTELDIVGLALDYCVKFTAIDGYNLGYKVNVLTNLTEAVNINPEDGELTIKEMKKIGIGV